MKTLKKQAQKPSCPECRRLFTEKDVRRVFLTVTQAGGDAGPSSQADAEPNEALIRHAQHICDSLCGLDVLGDPNRMQEIQEEIRSVAEAIKAESAVGDAARPGGAAPRLREETDRKLRKNQELLEAAYEDMEHTNRRASDRKSRLRELEDENAELRSTHEVLKEDVRRFHEDKRWYTGQLDKLKQVEKKQKADLRGLQEKNKQQASEIRRLELNAPKHEEESLVILSPDYDDPPRLFFADLQDQGGGPSQPRKRRKLHPSDSPPASSAPSSPTQTSIPYFSSPRSPTPLTPTCTTSSSPRADISPPANSSKAASKTHMSQPTRPHFGLPWTLPKPRAPGIQTKMIRSDSGKLPFPVDVKGKTKVTLQLGSRQKMNR
ncbi:hypothetical protein EW146_g5710 [Bondarzewia mesenterica]|uniref:Uncharacterized protein n=1 Tax=Bondarzewia mesenterica TaxID=1095465 RepID=A0A4S4LQN0_9AGAM|nr:hypothetical protein EW146_g5710 [Bondarzewia mesenterica]